jgi:hypothetical protein
MMQNISFSRTKVSTFFELSSAVLLLLGLLLSILFASKEVIVVSLCGVAGCGFTCFVLCALAYHPSTDMLHLPGVDLHRCNLFQLILVARLLRVLSLEVSVFWCSVTLALTFGSELTGEAIGKLFTMAFALVIFVTLALFSRRIRRAGTLRQ